MCSLAVVRSNFMTQNLAAKHTWIKITILNSPTKDIKYSRITLLLPKPKTTPRPLEFLRYRIWLSDPIEMYFFLVLHSLCSTRKKFANCMHHRYTQRTWTNLFLLLAMGSSPSTNLVWRKWLSKPSTSYRPVPATRGFHHLRSRLNWQDNARPRLWSRSLWTARA